MRLTVLTLSCLLTVPAAAQTAADSAGIREAALNYIEGWYAGDADRMERALHPALVKRIMNMDQGQPFVGEMSATALIRGARRGFGREIPAAERRTDVTILHVFRNAASAMIDAGGWIDYLHLVKWNGRWVILNVLWETRPPAGS